VDTSRKWQHERSHFLLWNSPAPMHFPWPDPSQRNNLYPN
jgi:hypothetical protein